MIVLDTMGTLTFGGCVLDLDARRLFRNGQSVHLGPKAFELLAILVSERPRAISKAELHERIWRGTFVSDDSLVRLVADARTAIGEDARRPAFLRTVHAFGYAFSHEQEASGAAFDLAVLQAWLVCGARATPLRVGPNLIGRDPAACVVLDSLRVSRRHAQITLGTPSAMLKDLGSRNGTLLNGGRIRDEAALSDGDEVGIGGFALKFLSGRVALPTEADD